MLLGVCGSHTRTQQDLQLSCLTTKTRAASPASCLDVVAIQWWIVCQLRGIPLLIWPRRLEFCTGNGLVLSVVVGCGLLQLLWNCWMYRCCVCVGRNLRTIFSYPRFMMINELQLWNAKRQLLHYSYHALVGLSVAIGMSLHAQLIANTYRVDSITCAFVCVGSCKVVLLFLCTVLSLKSTSGNSNWIWRMLRHLYARLFIYKLLLRLRVSSALSCHTAVCHSNPVMGCLHRPFQYLCFVYWKIEWPLAEIICRQIVLHEIFNNLPILWTS